MAGEESPGSPSEFEASLAELERIIEALEGEELRLDEALALFEEGVAHLRTANRLLEQARGRVEEVIADASGELRTVGFEPMGEGEDAG